LEVMSMPFKRRQNPYTRWCSSHGRYSQSFAISRTIGRWNRATKFLMELTFLNGRGKNKDPFSAIKY
jgi:hypothetical protein